MPVQTDDQASTDHQLFSVWVGSHLILLLQIQPPLDLLLVLPVQKVQQYSFVLLLSLVPTDILAPTPHRTRQPTGHVVLLDDLGDRMEIGADGEDHATTSRQAAQGLPLAAEEVVADGAVALRGVPGCGAGVLGADAVGPGQVIVDLDEIVVARHHLLRLQAAEEIHHALLQLGLETGDVT